jgi:AbrB family looped-hinge helix DNA binding protein
MPGSKRHRGHSSKLERGLKSTQYRTFTATLTSKGQMTVPVQLCRYLGLRPGERLVFEVDGEQFVARRLSKGVKIL